MNKYFAGVFIGFVAVLVGWVLIHEPGSQPAPKPSGSMAGLAEGGAPPAMEPELDAGALGAGGAPTIDESPGGGDPAAAAGGSRPGLAGAPKKIGLGVILVQYHGAEDAKPDTRSRRDALDLAKEVASLARDDFPAAVKKGDPGSTADAGSLSRGILDPEVEAQVFTLDKGAVSAPIDTPKGYWIVKRLE